MAVKQLPFNEGSTGWQGNNYYLITGRPDASEAIIV